MLVSPSALPEAKQEAAQVITAACLPLPHPGAENASGRHEALESAGFGGGAHHKKQHQHCRPGRGRNASD
ncbi:hypothetical protein M8494_38040 [Serratia ureilytica]